MATTHQLVFEDRKPTAEEIDWIVNNPWEVTARELAGSNRPTHKDQYEFLMDIAQNSYEVGISRVWHYNGRIVIAAGARPSKTKNTFVSYFAASILFNDHAMPITRGIRRWFKARQDDFPEHELIAVSGSTHEQRDRWFKLLGLHYNEERSTEYARVFEYQRS